MAFPWVETSTNMTGTPEGSTESGFVEKPGIKPATPGLQGIALIHYTTGASQFNYMWVVGFSPNLLTWVGGWYI